MAGLKLIEEARSAGLKLRAEGDRLVIRGPKSAELIAKALLDRKAEILPFLQEQPAPIVLPTPAPRPCYPDAREEESEAVTWLRFRLARGPQQIADLFSEWCAEVVGCPSREISERIDLLNNARWALDVQPFVGKDERFWWRLPQRTVQ